MNKSFAFFSALVLTIAAQASILKLESGDREIESILVSKTAQVTLQNQNIPVSLIGAGLRAKKVVIANVKVYVAQLFSSDASKFVRTDSGALASLADSRTTVMALTFLRTVDAPTVQQSFKDALKANNMNIDERTLATFLNAVSTGGDAEESKTMVIAIQKNANGTETVTYEDTNGHSSSINGEAGLTEQVMAIWLGTPADSGLKNLKQSLISGQ